jgi:hypothetical protein
LTTIGSAFLMGRRMSLLMPMRRSTGKHFHRVLTSLPTQTRPPRIRGRPCSLRWLPPPSLAIQTRSCPSPSLALHHLSLPLPFCGLSQAPPSVEIPMLPPRPRLPLPALTHHGGEVPGPGIRGEGEETPQKACAAQVGTCGPGHAREAGDEPEEGVRGGVFCLCL